MSKKALALTTVLAAATYAVLWIAVIADWPWLTMAETWILRQFHDFGMNRPGWIRFWQATSDVLSPKVLRIVALGGIVLALIYRRLRIAALLVLAVMAGLVTETAKMLSARPRPATALTSEASTAFPSGHVLGMTVGVLTLATILWPHLKPSMRRPVLLVGAALIVLVGLSRVILNVHYLTDVVAGCALGILYYSLCVALVRPWTADDSQESGLVSSD